VSLSNKNSTIGAIIEEYRGLSTDEKPLLPADRNGSTFFEMDTQDAYMFNGETLAWTLL